MFRVIIKRVVIAIAVVAMAMTFISCQKKKEEPQVVKNPQIVITISDGRVINLELNPDTAPITVENFLKLVNQNYYDGLCFHRIIDGFMIQGGGYYVDGKSIKEAPTTSTIVGEFESNGYRNDIKHTLGVISMARASENNSASGQFFICAGDSPHLDGSYAAFGKTLDSESNQVVLEIARSPKGNVGGGLTDFPYPIIVIESIREIKD